MNRAFQHVATAVLLGAATACGGFLRPGRAQEEAKVREPLADWGWESGVTFVFSDARFNERADYSAQIGFHDGKRSRVVGSGDLYVAEWDEIRTPWYRLWVPADSALHLKVRLVHRSGGVTEAEYTLQPIRRTGIYWVFLDVVDRDPREFARWRLDRRSYPLHPTASARPGESLWISYWGHGMGCPDCPL